MPDDVSSGFSCSLTFSCDGHHLYTANSEGTVIAWCRRDQQRMKLPMFYSFLSSYAAGWSPCATEPPLSDPADPERGGARGTSPAHDHHRIRPLIRHGNARHFMLCYKQLYHKERVKCVSIHASGVVRRSERRPFPPDHFCSLSSFVLCLVWLMIHVVVFVRDFWKLLESGPPKTRRLKACFSLLHYYVPRLCYPENRNPAFEAGPDWDNLNTSVCIGNPCGVFLSQTSACSGRMNVCTQCLVKLYLFSNKDESHI